MAAETAADRLKRLRMRSWRRGTREMDLILGPYADASLPAMDPAALDAYDLLLAQEDQDLLAWVLGQVAPPPAHAVAVARVADHARRRQSAG
jgi:antitoxin CptB